MNMKIEVIPIPVSNTDKAISFYEQVGFVLDHDIRVNEGLRFIQFTPPGSACSIILGDGITEMPIGNQYIQMVVDNAQMAYEELSGKGIEVTEPETLDWGIFIYFKDPDGNQWALQQIIKETQS